MSTVPPPTEEPRPAPTPPQRTSARAVAIVAIVIGAVVLLSGIAVPVTAMAIGYTRGPVSVSGNGDRMLTATVEGASTVRTDVAGGSLQVRFGDVTEAELEITGSWFVSEWSLTRSGNAIVVRSPRDLINVWPLPGNRIGEATLTLPEHSRGIDADLKIAGGDFSLEGTVGDIEMRLAGGNADIEGTADSIVVEASAGNIEMDLADVDQADLSLSAGSIEAELSGDQPSDIRVFVTAGSLELTVPAGDYWVTDQVTAGSFDNEIGSNPQADNVIDVTVTAGDVTLESD